MEFVTRKTYEKLIVEHVSPKHVLPDDKVHAAWEFYRNLRFAVTRLITTGVFEEITA